MSTRAPKFHLWLLPLLLLAACAGSGYRKSESAAWVRPSANALAKLRYAVLPIEFTEESIPEDLFGPWRTQRKLSLSIHMRRELEDALRQAGFWLADRESLGIVLGDVGTLPASWTRDDRQVVEHELGADAVISVTVLDASPTRVSAVIEATRVTDGELIWSCERSDYYGSETPDQGSRLVRGLISKLRVAGLPLRR